MRKAILILFLFFLPLTALAFSPIYKFTDQEHDRESGLYYYINRHYDPNLGRFIQPDPMVLENVMDLLTNPQSLNPYTYTLNNPIRYIDPLGLLATEYDMPENGWQFGDEMGDLNSVVAYYNGTNIANETFSCVDYAKRYMFEKYGIDNIGKVYSAKNMWNTVDEINTKLNATESEYSFKQSINGQGFVLPQEGDLLFWTNGAYGHVMVVSEAVFDESTNSGYVEIVNQNYGLKAVNNFDITKTNNGYSILQHNNNPMAGWLSPVNNNPSANTNSYSALSATPSIQYRPSFFQPMWDSLNRIFKGLF